MRFGVLSLVSFALLAWLSPEQASCQSWDQVVAKAREEGEVVVSGPPFRDLSAALDEGLQRAYGIRVEYMAPPPGEASVKIVREASAGKGTVDIYLGGGRTPILVFLPNGLLETLPDKLYLPEVKDGANWKGGKLKWVDGKKQFVLQTAEWVMTDLFVNTDRVKPQEIDSWKDLLRPRWKGKIAAHDPRRAGPGGALADYLLHKFGEEFIVRLYKGQEVVLTHNLRQLTEWVARGSYPIVLASVQTMVELFRKEGFPIARVFPKDGPGSLVGGWGTLVMIKNSPHPNAAAVFLNWFASREGQNVFAQVMLEPSLRTDVPRNSVPDYVLPRPGIKYDVDQYVESWLVEVAPRVQERLFKALGR